MQSVEATAKLLAGEYVQEDTEIERILWAPAENEVRLIDVTKSITDRGEVLPFRFSPDPPDVPYASVVILLAPGDWERIKAHDLDLPDSFSGKLEQLYARQDGDGMILIDDYPQLATVAWNRKVRTISPEEALALYEAHPQWIDRGAMDAHEQALLDSLVARYAQGVWLDRKT